MTTARDLGITDSRAHDKGVIEIDAFLQKQANAAGYKRYGETLVIGSTDEALEAACIAARCGAQKVVIVCRERATEIQAAPEKVAEAQELGARMIRGWAPMHADIYKDGRVSGVFFKHCDRLYDETGHYAPIYDESNVMAQYCDSVILADSMR